ncbi:MAG: hypothetical protein LBB10_03285 [Bifidobacteriaceae bacterium]|jgi:hypothetical protein|nr:hypothetical protein [Bifidobacteriaceae bacterium]
MRKESKNSASYKSTAKSGTQKPQSKKSKIKPKKEIDDFLLTKNLNELIIVYNEFVIRLNPNAKFIGEHAVKLLLECTANCEYANSYFLSDMKFDTDALRDSRIVAIHKAISQLNLFGTLNALLYKNGVFNSSQPLFKRISKLFIDSKKMLFGWSQYRTK